MTSSPPWKCDVEILMSDEYLAKRNQSFDTLFCDKKGPALDARFSALAR
jgi:hypothetical protein